MSTRLEREVERLRIAVEALAVPIPGPTGPQGLPGETLGMINVKSASYGAIADGDVHPLSGFYASLAAAQVVYPFATSLTQQIDYCACKLASNTAFGGDLEVLTAYVTVSQISDDTHIYDATQNWVVNEHAGRTAFRKFLSNGFVTSQTILSNTATVLTLAAAMPFGSINSNDKYAIGYGEHGDNTALNAPICLPEGAYWFGNDTWRIRNLASGTIFGAGKLATTIRGNKTLLAFDGLWYSKIRDMALICEADDATAAMEIDGNVPGHAYATRGVQSVTLQDLLIDGGGSTYALALNRQGGSDAQGSECVFINLHMQRAAFACYYQNGFNALNNTFIGGNFQSYPKHGAYVVGGTVEVYGTGFQSTYGYEQYDNDGWDILVGQAGAYEACVIHGCRTESIRFLLNAGAVKTDVRACVGNLDMVPWSAATVYGPGTDQGEAILHGSRVFVATTPGTSGGSEPTWPTDGSPVSDGTIVWEALLFNSIDIATNSGSVDLPTVSMTAGFIKAPPKNVALTVAADATVGSHDIIVVDATAADRAIALPSQNFTMQGRVITVKKSDTSAHTVSVTSTSGFEDGTTTNVIPGSSRGWRTYALMDGTAGVLRWHIIGSG